MTTRRVSKEELEEAIKASLTMSDALRKLGIYTHQSQPAYYKRRAQEYGISMDHFEPYVPEKWGGPGLEKPTHLILVKGDRRVSAKVLTRAMVQSGVPHLCAGCGRGPKWQNKPLMLQIDHINGDSTDQRIENLRFLCPNCHSQTDNFCGRKNKKYREVDAMGRVIKHQCPKCGGYMSKYGELCRKCSNGSRLGKGQKIEWPELDWVVEEVSRRGFLAVGTDLGVTDSSVRKFVRNRGIDPKSLSSRKGPVLSPKSQNKKLQVPVV